MSTPPLRDRLQAILPAVRGRRRIAESSRQVPAETISALHEAGVFRAPVPHRYGGEERSLREIADLVVELSSACSATGWVTSLFAFHSFAAAWFDSRAQQELWATGPDTRIASSLAPVGRLTAVDGGFRVDGRWTFVSGVDHASWVILGGVLAGMPPVPHHFLVNVADYVIEDDWHVAGLRGSGSKSLALSGTFVPAHRALALTDPIYRSKPPVEHDGALYRLPWRLAFPMAFPPVALGTTAAMIAEFRDRLATRVHAYRGTSFRMSTAHLARLAEATSRFEGARALFARSQDLLDGYAARASGDAAALAGHDVSYNCAFIIDECKRIVDSLFEASGGMALREDNPLQQHFRDVHAMRMHTVADVDTLAPALGSKLIELAEAGRDPT